MKTRGYRAVGVDLSSEQRRHSQSRCPTAQLIRADIGTVEFAAQSFAGVLAYDSLWHLPRNEHQDVFRSIRRWLVSGGTALLTVAVGDGELFTELMGAPVFYDAWPETTTQRMLQTAGLTIVGHDFQPVESGRAEGHLIVLVSAM